MTTRPLARACQVLLACAFSLVPLVAQDAAPAEARRASAWPAFGGPAGNGTSPETGLAKTWSEDGPPILWKQELGPGYGGAAVHDGSVFVFDRILREADVLRVFDLETGEELWSWQYDAPGSFDYQGSRSVPAVEEDYVYTVGAFGHVHCIDRVTHKAVWSVHLADDFEGITPGYGFVQSPLVVDDLVIVTPLAEKVGLVALDRRTGEEVWRTVGLGTSHSTPTVMELGGVQQIVFLSALNVPVGGRNIFQQMREMREKREKPEQREEAEPPEGREPGQRRRRGGRWGELTSSRFEDGVGSVAGFDPKTGEQLWSTDLYFCWQPVCAPMRVDSSRVFLTGGYRSGSMMLEVTRGRDGRFAVKELFRHPRGSHIHVPLLHDEHLYLIVNENFNTRGRSRQREGGLMCLDLAGNEVWRTGAEPFFGRGNALLADGVLWVQDGNSGTLRVVEPTPTGYTQLAEANVFGVESSRRDKKMWAPMALSDGRLLMRSQWELRCVDLRPRAK